MGRTTLEPPSRTGWVVEDEGVAVGRASSIVGLEAFVAEVARAWQQGRLARPGDVVLHGPDAPLETWLRQLDVVPPPTWNFDVVEQMSGARYRLERAWIQNGQSGAPYRFVVNMVRREGA